MRIRLKDPIRSMQAKQRQHPREGTKGINLGVVNNPHGLGSILAGEPSRNPKGKGGFSDNPPNHVLAARFRCGFKPKQNANPLGRAGFKAAGIKKMDKKVRRTPEGEALVKTLREIQELCAKCVPDGIDAMKEIIQSDTSSDMAKIAAFHAVVERAYGKPTQTNVNANIDGDAKPGALDGNELDKRIAEALERVDAITNRERETLESEERPADLRKLN